MQKLISYLELFLKKNVVLLLQGDQALKLYENDIPNIWKEVILTDISVPYAIEKVWQPILPYLHDISKMVDQITNIGLVVSPSQSSPIGLIYIFQHIKSEEIFSWLGYSPVNPNQLLHFEERFGFPLPTSYQRFCVVHNGLLRDGWNSHGPRPLEKLRLFELNQDRAVPKHQLLAFSGDGAGNEQCYNLNMPTNNNDYLTVDWDHESHKLGPPYTFWTYFETLLKLEMGIHN